MKYFPKTVVLLAVVNWLWCLAAKAQTEIFPLPAKGWEQVGKASVPMSKPEMLTTVTGDGILASRADKKGRPDDLISAQTYGDIELELSYLLAAGSEATLYLHDIYPITLADTRLTAVPTAGTNGGAAGYAPRHEVGRAPGIWQQLHVRFRAPQFDAAGKKTAPARLESVKLNGVVLHEEVQLTVPIGVTEDAVAAIRFSLASGPIALKDIAVNRLQEREQESSRQQNGPDPILVAAQINTTLRSFMDIPGGPRVVHAISAGHPEQVHYTYDLDHGNLFQVWRGGFLDATPMWNDRGNGTARILGSAVYLGSPALTVGKLAALNDQWPADTNGTGYKPNGYVIDSRDLPTFRYQVYGQQLTDSIRPLVGGEGFVRTISVSGNPEDLYLRLAVAATITDQGKGVYLIGDNAWYLKLEDTGKRKPIIRDQQQGKELLVPISSVVRYSIIF